MKNQPNVGDVWSVDAKPNTGIYIYILKIDKNILRVAFVCNKIPNKQCLTECDILVDGFVIKTWHCTSIPKSWIGKFIHTINEDKRSQIFENSIKESLTDLQDSFRQEELKKTYQLSFAATMAVMDEFENSEDF